MSVAVKVWCFVLLGISLCGDVSRSEGLVLCIIGYFTVW